MNNTVRDAVAALVADMRTTKAAEAASEVQAAYVAGFGKAAEALGVSPRALARRAAVRSAMEKDAQPQLPPQQLPQQVADNFPARGGTRAFGNHYMEQAGQWATLGEGTALGTMLGSQRANRWLGRLGFRGFKGKGRGALVGLSAGMLTNLFARAKGAVTRGRTAQDQIDHDRMFRPGSLFVPGSGAYNAVKRDERKQLSQWHG